jgi:hypothetical protein
MKGDEDRYLVLVKADVAYDLPKISLNVEESARFFLKVELGFKIWHKSTSTMFLLSSKIPQRIPMYAKIHQLENKNHTRRFFKEEKGGLRAPETMSPLGVIKPKCDEKQQGEGGGS